jgi:hypothetical protein
MVLSFLDGMCLNDDFQFNPACRTTHRATRVISRRSPGAYQVTNGVEKRIGLKSYSLILFKPYAKIQLQADVLFFQADYISYSIACLQIMSNQSMHKSSGRKIKSEWFPDK